VPSKHPAGNQEDRPIQNDVSRFELRSTISNSYLTLLPNSRRAEVQVCSGESAGCR
jgi:hypothetical protein